MPHGLACAVGPPRVCVCLSGLHTCAGKARSPLLVSWKTPGRKRWLWAAEVLLSSPAACWPGAAAWPRLLRPAAGAVPDGAVL